MAFFPGRALVIGVGTYRHEPWLDVPICAADAQAVAAVLRDPDYCGYPLDRVSVLHDATTSRDELLTALDDLAAQAREDDTVFLFFCGHGDYGDDGDYYLTTHDTRVGNGKVVSGSALREGELIERLRAVKAKRLLLLVNACHSGELSPTLGPSAPTFGDTPLPDATAAALLATGEGRIIITACRDGQVSWIGPGALTLFTQALVDGLRGQGTRSSRGYVSAFDLYLHLYDSVKETVAQRYGQTQEPELTVLKGVGPFAVSLFRGATTLGDFDSTAPPPEGAAVREVSPERARSRLRQFKLHVGDSFRAELHGDGAIAQGPGATALGKGAVQVGGKNTGNINTDTQINTGGGAYISGAVSAGGDFIGRDQVKNGFNRSKLTAKTINIFTGNQRSGSPKADEAGVNIAPNNETHRLHEDIRLDVASPSSVVIGVEFDVAVAIRQPDSLPLSIKDLDNSLSAKGIIERAANQDVVRYKVEILSADFAIDPPRVVFLLERNRDSEVKWFKLTARKNGKRSFIVVAYQVDGDIEIASTRVTLKSVVESGRFLERDVELALTPVVTAVEKHATSENRTTAIRQLEQLRAEAAKGEQAEDCALAAMLERLAEMVPEAIGAMVATFAMPVLSGVAGPVTRYVLDKLKRS